MSCVNSYGQPSDGCVESSRPQNTQSCNSGECLPTPLGKNYIPYQCSRLEEVKGISKEKIGIILL